MNTTVKKLPKSRITLTITLDDSEWLKYRSQAIRKLSGQLSIPGFRKGHVPEAVLIKNIGEENIIQEAIELLIPQTYMDAIRSENLGPLEQPEIKMLSPKPFSYEATFAVLPKVTTKPLGKVKIPNKSITVTKKEIDEMIEMFQGQLATRKTVERASKKGDTVVIDFSGFDLDGVPLDNTASKNHPVEIGSKTMISGFEEELVGLKAKEEKSFTITFPKDYNAKSFAGKKVRFDIVVHAVDEKILPEVDEKFVESLTGTKKSVDELRNEIESALKERKTNEQRQEQEVALLEAVAKHVTVELPEILISEEVEYLIDGIKMRGLQQGIPWEQYLEHMKKSEEDLAKEMRSQAEMQVKTRLGIQEYIREAKVTATEDEILHEIERTLNRMNEKQREKEKDLFRKNARGWQEAENRIRVQKWVDGEIEKMLKEK